MKTLHINDKTTVSGGVEVYIHNLMPLLRERGIETHWISTGISAGKAWIESEDGNWNWKGNSPSLEKSPLLEWIDDQTVFHVHSLSEPKLIRQLFQMAPVVRHMHEPRMFCPGQGKFWAADETICEIPFGPHCVLHAYTKRCCNRHPKTLRKQYANTHYEVNEASTQYSAIITNSNWTHAEALKAGYPSDALHLLHCFTEALPEPPSVNTEPRVVFTGRLSRTKGVHYLLHAMPQVLRSVPNAQLDVLGSGHNETEFKQLAKDLQIDHATFFHGWSDRKTAHKITSKASVVAFPSIYPEAFGISGIEAMMLGKPVVGFNVGGVPDWLKDGRTGISVPAKDSNALAIGLTKILTDQSLRNRMGEAARRDAVAKFTPTSHLAQLLPVYQSCIAR